MRTFKRMVNELFGGLHKNQVSIGRDYIPTPEQLAAMDGSLKKDISFGSDKFNKAVEEMQNELTKNLREGNPTVGIVSGDSVKEMKDWLDFVAAVELDKQTLRDMEVLSASRDIRYTTPKEKHKASEEQIDKVIAETELYIRAKERILKAQRGQVGYGIDKYPEPLTAETWSIFEALDHIMDESIDRMHYLEMLREHFTLLVKELEELREYKDNIENLYGGPIIVDTGGSVSDLYKDAIAVYTDSNDEPVRVYSDHHIYPETLDKRTPDHDGDSTYIRNCKAKTLLVAEQELEDAVKNMKESYDVFSKASDIHNKLKQEVI